MILLDASIGNEALLFSLGIISCADSRVPICATKSPSPPPTPAPDMIRSFEDVKVTPLLFLGFFFFSFFLPFWNLAVIREAELTPISSM